MKTKTTQAAGHTPGPWKVRGGVNEAFIDAPGVVCLAVVNSLSDSRREVAQMRRDARLIASAPDLLAGLAFADVTGRAVKTTLRALRAALRQTTYTLDAAADDAEECGYDQRAENIREQAKTIRKLLRAKQEAAMTPTGKPSHSTAAAGVKSPAGQTCGHCGLSGQPPDSLKCDDCGRNLPAAGAQRERDTSRVAARGTGAVASTQGDRHAAECLASHCQGER